MKKVLIVFMALSTQMAVAQKRTNWDYIADIKPISWTKEVRNTTTTHIEGNKTSSTIAGGAVGHIIAGKDNGLLGTLGGAAIGYAMGDSDDDITSTTVSYVKVDGYFITTGKGVKFKTLDYYTKFSTIDLNKVKKE